MGKRILFFESDQPFAAAVRKRLQAHGASVELVDDGNAGLQRATAERPDLILLTIELPQMNGFLVCKKLKKNPETQNIPVVILSSEATEDIFEQHRKLRTRAEDYLRKPIPLDDLVQRVRALVELSDEGAGAAAPLDLSEEAMEIPLDDVEEVEAVPAAEPPAGRKKKGVDDEIEAFAESAFDALVMGEEVVERTTV
ncbi:MAG: response regulator, partial [Sandaracinaceae bacterium]|nr:response regulator [Sandaracinaceae bacterium]